MKIRKVIKKIFKYIALGFIILIAYFIGESTYENIKKNQLINEFKSRAYETYEVNQHGTTYFYHKIKRTHDYEINDPRNVFYDEAKVNPGIKGDILITFESPFPYVPVIDQIYGYWLGGHTALVGENNRIYQSTGITDSGSIDFGIIFDTIMFRGYDEDNSLGLSVQSTNNTWMVPFRNEFHPEYPYYGRFYRDEILATRLKFKDNENRDDEIDVAVEYAKDKVNRGLYNYLFLVDTKYKYYCSDLVTRAFSQINQDLGTSYNLNGAGLYPSMYDILLSDDTYITIYKETKADGIHVYYLEDVEA
jgi:hypothetical protein